MLWFSKYKHHLPKYPPEIAKIFKRLCETLDDKAIAELRVAVESLEDDVNDKREGSQLDCRSLMKLKDCCLMLLDRYKDYAPAEQALIVGAVRYVAVADDPLDDEIFASGLWDDKMIINYVLERIGLDAFYFPVD